MAVNDATKRLRLQNNTFAYYATPTLKIDKKGNIVQRENNIIELNSRTQVWSRTWPKTEPDLRVECASSRNEKKASMISWSRKIFDNLGITNDGTSYESYFCENMITLSSGKKNRTDGSALIALGYGKDVANGFKEMKNYSIIGGGEKQVAGGEFADVFHFIGDDAVHGSIDGQEGGNIVDLSQYLIFTKL
uniref:Uncharacterized protein n=1 Tax=Romanomermis culicivorax TaxID=13658 RepID=A0A915K0S9_ROMCU